MTYAKRTERVTVWLSEESARRLNALAERRNLPTSELVRQWIEAELLADALRQIAGTVPEDPNQ